MVILYSFACCPFNRHRHEHDAFHDDDQDRHLPQVHGLRGHLSQGAEAHLHRQGRQLDGPAGEHHVHRYERASAVCDGGQHHCHDSHHGLASFSPSRLVGGVHFPCRAADGQDHLGGDRYLHLHADLAVRLRGQRAAGTHEGAGEDGRAREADE